VNGQKDWNVFAKENGIKYEHGRPQRFDRCGNEYDTYIWPEGDNARLLKYLGRDKYVIVRMHPQTEKGLVRMRLSSYLEKPT
jgi:hypothetical protein